MVNSIEQQVSNIVELFTGCEKSEQGNSELPGFGKKKQLFSINGFKVILTLRELQCLYYLYKGKTAYETAACLYLSRRTVETHLANLKQKVGCSSKIELLHQLWQGRLEISH